ncbi:hypothetical protein Ahy_Scaffold6g107963 [Arachis hypogaea]|uniref:Uncharacterized protein n=1 Tax=Arachis hypogaea TaxID=3818 RepID=A0A444WP20_ARAHY|nr:hypothetical protein Ahy_Scaffold6g107963 [Arachis hypogaea]
MACIQIRNAAGAGKDLFNLFYMATLRRTTVSMVRPGPNPKSTPQSSPSPVVLSPSSRDFFLIKSMMKNTHALDILP